MAKKIAIANQKGGVGKTTSTLNLAAGLYRTGKRVLMIDMDPQYSLTVSCAMLPDVPEYHGMSTCSLYNSNIDPLDCCFTVDSIPGNKALLFIVPSSQQLAITAKNLFIKQKALSVFKHNIEVLDDFFDYIFFDCPPSLDELLTSSLISADSVIVPVKPEKLSYAGLDLIIPTINAVRTSKSGNAKNPDLKLAGIIATMYRGVSKEHKEYVAKIAEEYNLLGIVPLSAIVNKEIGTGVPVVIAHANSNAAKAYIEISSLI